MKRLFTIALLSATFCALPFRQIFSQCSTTLCNGFPPPALVSEDACIMCDPCIINGYVGNTGTPNVGDVPAPFCGSVENNQWFAFLAPASGTLSLQFNSYNCAGAGGGSGIQAEMYSTDDCNNFVSVSNCWSPGSAGTGIVTATGLQPFCTYYLMIDGWAGDVCEFTITTLDCVAPPPPPTIQISGNSEVCPGSTTSYCIPENIATVCDNSGGSVIWTINPPIGTIVGADDETCVEIHWDAPGNAVITVTTDNVCFGGSSATFPVTSAVLPPQIQEYTYCLGECVECAGTFFCQPGVHSVTLQNWLGCDSIIHCVFNQVLPIIVDLGNVTICYPETFTSCGMTFEETGIYSPFCDNWQGCDSTNIVNLAVLRPIASVAGPGLLGCAPGSTVVLDGSASNSATAVGATTTYSWSGPAGGINTPTNLPTVTVDLPGTYCLTLTHARGGKSCTDVKCVTVVKDDKVPQTPQITGDNNPCIGESVTYSVTPVGSPAPTSFTWTTSNGNTFTQPSPNSIQIAWANSGNVQVCVTANNACGSSSPACFNVAVEPAPTASISGSKTVCPGSNSPVDFTITLTGTGPWDIGYSLDGGTPTPLHVETSPFILTQTQVGTYVLTGIVNAPGCTGTVSGSATISEYPLPTAVLGGGGEVCAGTNQTTNLTIDLSGISPWTVNWTINGLPQAPLTVNGTPYNLPLGAAQSGDVLLTGVTGANGCPGFVSGSATVGVNTAPTVSGITVECDPTNVSYVVYFDINGGESGSYVVTPGTGFMLGNTFTSDPILSGNGYGFVVDDANHCNPATVADPVVLCNCTTAAGDMPLNAVEECGDGPVSVNYDASAQAFDGDDVLEFVLHSGSGVTIESPVIGKFSSPSVGFTPGAMTYGTTYYLSAVVGNPDGAGGVDLSDPCSDVSQGTPIVFYEIPSANLLGDPAICEGEQTILSVNFTGASPWSITYDAGAGAEMANGITSNPYSLLLNPAASTQVILTGMSDSHCPGDAAGTSEIIVNTGVSVSNVMTTCNQTGTAYVVSFTIGGGDPASYFWSGMVGSLTATPPYVFTGDPQDEGTGYSILVDDANSCDPQTVAQTQVTCLCVTAVGQMSATAVEQCGDAAVTVNYDATNQVLDPDDSLIFILHTNSGAAAGAILAKNTSPTFAFDPATMDFGTTYFISAVAGTTDGAGGVMMGDPCTEVAPGTPVTFFEIPTATLSGDASICAGESSDLSVQLTGEVPWTLHLGGQIMSNVNTSGVTQTVTPAATTSYAILAISDAHCPGTISGGATVQVNFAPQIVNDLAVCDADTTTFSVSFTVTGGDPASYEITPPNGTLNGNSFTSNPLASNFNYIFSVDDEHGCGPVTVTGTQDCDCETEAGTMSQVPRRACVGESITVPASFGGVFLDQNDELVYVLHVAQGNQLGSVIATNPTPTFNFDPATMQTGVNYYVSALAGNAGVGIGGVDTSDFCLDIALPGTPVLWNPLPSVNLVGSDAICEGDTAQVLMFMMGVGTAFTVNYTINGTAYSNTSNSPYEYHFTPSQNTTITLTSVTDVNTGCTDNTFIITTIQVSENVNAGVTNGNIEACVGDDIAYQLADFLTGEDSDGVWTDPAGNVLPGGTLATTCTQPGTFTYTYIVSTSAPCFGDTAFVDLTVHPNPVADAGPDHLLDCDVTEAVLGGDGTSVGMSYSWSGGNVSDPGILHPTTSESGIYTLAVTNLLNDCAAADFAVVTEIVTMPQAHVRVSPVSCFGKKDGFIVVDSITNGLPPFLCAFDGGAFGDQKVWENLTPGNHVLLIMDAAGCQQQFNFFVNEPEQVSVDLQMTIPNSEELDLVEFGDTVILAVVVTPPFDSLDAVIWTPGGSVPCDTCQTNIVTPTHPTTYSIRVEKNGCADEDQATVSVKKTRPIFVPNAFSPNGDQTNDWLVVFGGDPVVVIKKFLVFSRWGETVFEQYNFAPNDPANGWDGKHRGETLNPAVFTWFAEVEFTDGRVMIFEGDTAIVK